MKENREIKIIANMVLTLCMVTSLLPFILLIVASFTDNNWALANGFSFFPEKWSLEAYLYIANKWEMIGHAYLMTVVVTVLGTVLSLSISSLYAYGLSKRDLPGGKVLSFLLIFTMLFNGGLVATYYSYVNFFHIRNTLWAVIVPGLLMTAFKTILIKNYFQNSIPESLLDAARIDGAGEFKTFLGIVLPLSLPILATVGLMDAIAYWNSWQNGLYYLSDRGGRQYYTIQVVLNQINDNINFLNSSGGDFITDVIIMPGTTARMAIAAVGIVPIIIAYPFFQRYFVKGITIGGVKE